ncbi:MAG: MMPL family transporter [Syntrophobacteraceae bacterium]
MLSSWGRLVYRFRWLVAIVSLLSLLPAAWLTIRGGHLESVMNPTGSESSLALQLMKEQLLPSLPSFGLVFRSPTLHATDPVFRAAVERAIAPLRKDPLVASLDTAYKGDAIRSQLVSQDGHATIVTVKLKNRSASETELAMRIYPEVRAKVHSHTLEIAAFGEVVLNHAVTRQAEQDAKNAELRVLPFVALLLLFVFGSVPGAALPLAVGLLAVTSGIAGMLLLARVTPVMVFAKNIIVMVGLGVAIDYSLFLLSRFREEVRRHSVVEALAVTLATTGRAVLFSGGTVAVGLFGILFLRLGNLGSIGLAGAIVVTLSVVYSMTFLPALLAILGPRVDSLRLPFLARKADRGAGFWQPLANVVMAHPWKVIVPSALLLVLLGLPFLHIRLGFDSAAGLPRTAESRRGMDLVRSGFPKVDTNPIVVIVRFPKGFTPLTVDHVNHLYALSRWMAKLPGVEGVKSIVDLAPSLTRWEYVQMLTPPMPPLPEGIHLALKKMVGRDIVMLVAETSLPAGSAKALDLVRTIRASHPPVGGELLVAGESAFQLDFVHAIEANAPRVIGLIVLITFFLLFLLLRSVLLPLKAVLMNLLSITASYGALVWFFQYGHLASVLHFTPGPIEPMVPIIMFCILFGLSMDYEVLLLNRVHYEYERSGDNTRAVARALERTGRMITGAAAIMALVLFAFAFAQMTVVKAMGIGMGISVVVDATIVRCLLVPATMRLLGRWNWWVPHLRLRGRRPSDRKKWSVRLNPAESGAERSAVDCEPFARGVAKTSKKPPGSSPGTQACEDRRSSCG